MSDMSDGIGAVLSALNTLEAPGKIEYRAVVGTGAWAELTGAILHQRSVQLMYSDDQSREQLDQEATLIVPIGQALLASDYEVRISESESNKWTVTSGPDGTNQSEYTLTRVTPKAAGPNRRRL